MTAEKTPRTVQFRVKPDEYKVLKRAADIGHKGDVSSMLRSVGIAHASKIIRKELAVTADGKARR